MAKKKNSTPDEIDITTFQWVQAGSLAKMGVPGCGGCHPGGGGLEFDRDGNRYDLHLMKNPGLRRSLDGDYHKSHWDKSGVVEADCFICHLEDYNFKLRNKQLKLWNYKWASIAASGIGVVKGTVARVVKQNGKTKKVLTGVVPGITYNRRLFNQDGKLSVDLSWPPPSKNCTFCHGYSDRKKRGFSWNDPKNHDIHNIKGLECAHCHPSIDDMHNFAKGDENVSTVRDDLDNQGMMTCKKCHEEGIFGAPRPLHLKVRPNHLEKISCETCHIPVIHANGGSYFDVTSGEMINYGRLKNEANLTTLEELKKAPFMPIPTMNSWIPMQGRNHKTHQIEPVNPFPRGLMYSNLDADGIYYPLFMREIKKAYSKVKGRITKQPYKKGPFKGKPKLYKKDEIKLYLMTLTKTLQGSKRFKKINPHMHSFGTLYHIDGKGNLIEEKDHTWAGEGEAFNINHNVSPAKRALGAKGCTDCHSMDGMVFRRYVMTGLWGADGTPEFIRNGYLIECTPFAFWVNSFYQKIITPYVSIGILLIVFFLMIHYTGQGPKGADFILEPATIERFNSAERITHWVRMITFIILAFTGAIFFYNSVSLLRTMFDSQLEAIRWHWAVGLIFTAASVVALKLWAKDAKFTDYDSEWLEKKGGYFGGREVHVPAGRLNAGQKIAFWINAGLSGIMALTGIMLIFKSSLPLGLSCFVSTFHGLMAIVFLAIIIGHAYLGTMANPGTWRAMVDGRVGENWAKKHHSEWYKEITGEDEEESGE